MKDLLLAYVCWMTACVGLCGIHRFYLNSPLMGFIYLFTLGLFGLGQLMDLFLIPSLVESCNLRVMNNYHGGAGNIGQNHNTGAHYYSLFGGGAHSQPGITFSFGHHHHQPQAYIPPNQEGGQETSSREGQQEEQEQPQEYVPPQHSNNSFNFGFNPGGGISVMVNGQPVDLSQGGTFFMNENGIIEGGGEDEFGDGGIGYTPSRNDRMFEEQARRNRDHFDQLNRQRMMDQQRRDMENHQRIMRENNRRHMETTQRVHQMNMQNMNRIHEQNRNMVFQQQQRMQFQNNLNNTMRMHQMNTFPRR
ncbi:hypothetical protein C9374_002191 [Naegleria lovaniensis]|uniref:TM2 domain-containing protein n=1 Tax=Naegleria lovaniensis TaxID=51637 RepID=A0AA88GSX9_NAELO|nr:uncharacterized protein C9374_002191 [Naegleria lovaniensis]KAG2386447.1 hypothetical protein C9374_002191 [Naegleria lovaniensis]